MEVFRPARIPANDVGCAFAGAALTPSALAGKPVRAFDLLHPMKKPVFSPRLALLPLALCAITPAWSQTSSLEPVVVTATRSPTRTDELVSDVTVITRETIEASTARTLAELLARNAGVQSSSNGGLGKSSSVFIRGTESRHTILLVDGVRLGSATLGTPSWDNIPLEAIERIEVLKGPASALYGSEGVGGVVQIFTRKGMAGFHPYATATVGSKSHGAAAAGFSAGRGDLDYSLGVQHLRERGFSATNPNVPFGNFNPDRDPFRQDSLNASARYRINPGWSVDAGLLYANGVSAFDDGPDRDSRLRLRDLTAHIGVKAQLAAGWHSELTLSQGKDTSNTIEAAFPGAFRTSQSQWTWQNNVDTPLGVVLAGLEHRVQKVDSSTDYDVNRRTIDSAFAGLNGSAGRHSWQLNLRHDGNSQFGGSNTGFVGYGFRITPEWRVHASHGTSFVAPSFNQLYFPGFGNPALQPERGRNTDIGVSWKAHGQEVKLVRFDNRIRGFITSTTTPGNDGRFDALAVRASVDRLDARNELKDLWLPRRARQQLTLGADYGVGDWRFGGSLLHVGSRFDDAANTRPLDSYTTADAFVAWQFARDFSLQAKLNNLTDKQYETAYGYNQPPRSFYLTLRWQPK
jgi:vitamin B12 transporter